MSLPTMSGAFRCVKDPEIRWSQGGMAVCSFFAVADKKKNDGTRENPNWVDDKVIFVKITTFKRLAEHVASSVFKGVNVIIPPSEVNVATWEKNDGTPMQTVEVIANDLGVSLFWDEVTVNKAERSGGGQQGGGGQQRQQRTPADDPWSSAPSGTEEPPF
jgi:single-strand DNA-binding protein